MTTETSIIEQSTQTSWNLSEWRVNIIGFQLKKASNHYSRGQYVQFFTCWKNIRLSIDNRLTKEQIGLCVRWENLIPKTGSFVDNALGRKFVSTDRYKHCVEQYASMINVFLRKIGLDIKEKGQSKLF